MTRHHRAAWFERLAGGEILSLVMIAFACLAAVTSPARAAGTLTFEPKASTVAFELDAFLHTVHGTAQLERSEIAWDDATKICSGQIVINATSLDTGKKT